MAERVAREIWLEAEAEAVWEAVTDGAWLADEAHLDLRPGGDAWFRCGEQVRSGWVEEVTAPGADGEEGRLAFWWAIDDEPASRVELTVCQRAGQTRVRVVEARPLDALDLVGLPLAGGLAGRTYGPALSGHALAA
jgi:uncharacterized protein YndB with AHSA1/START domain